ncbi:uncharacterized protein isoform X1 [Musca autumnalis]|uniref:uncharacterized protein isoform X1 n=1 Tax=Musca autumnalis TaxID=221902 RepID=UPI003CEDB0D0
MADQVRKWNLGFEGEQDPLEFLERVEELASMYALQIDMLPKMMPEMMKGKALIWFRNNNQRWQTWADFREDFRRFFLPTRFWDHLEDDIRKRLQRPSEKFRDYALSLQNMMRHSNYSEEQKLERIFKNALPEYLWNIRRRDFKTLHELLAMGEDLENFPPITAQAKEQHRRLEPEISPAGSHPAPINPRTACRRCGQDGHFATGCRNEVMLFCWECGRSGNLNIYCCRKRTSGNERRPRREQVETGPQVINKPLH